MSDKPLISGTKLSVTKLRLIFGGEGTCKIIVSAEDDMKSGSKDRSKSQSLCKRFCLKHFERWNAVAALVHLINAVLTYALPGTEDEIIPVYESYASWTSLDNTDITKDNCPSNQYVLSVNRTNGSEMFLVNPRAKKEAFTLSLQLLIFSFHFLSFMFQGSIPVYSLVYNGCSLHNDQYVKDIKERGVNTRRFVEYSISATLMLVCIALVSGIDEFNALFTIVVLTSVTMVLGLVVELLFDDQLIEKYTEGFMKETKKRNIGRMATKLTELRQYIMYIGKIVHATAWVTMISAYGGIIIKYYILSIQESDVEPPLWVTLVIFTVMFLYLVFGGIQFVQLWFKAKYLRLETPKEIMKSKNIQVELAYIVNSLVTKTILGWTIILNLTDLTDNGKIMCPNNLTTL